MNLLFGLTPGCCLFLLVLPQDHSRGILLKNRPACLEIAVSLQELESAVSQLPAEELIVFARWFEEYLADAWDRRIEADIKAGRLDEAGRRADADFEAGRCKPL